MKNICIKNKGENINFNDYKLSILCTQNGLSYSLYSIIENRINALVAKDYTGNNYTDEIKEFFLKEELYGKDFKDINILFASNKITIVPNVLFDKNNFEKIFYLNFESEENEIILFSELPKSENTLIYSIPKNIFYFFKELFPKSRIFSQSVPFIEVNFTNNKIHNRNKSRMFVQVYENFIEILVFQNEKILLYNTFKYKTNNDILYFVVNIFEQLKLSQEETEVIFSGFLETDNLAVLKLRKFVKMVYFESLNQEFKYFYKFQEILPHYFVNFLNINKCE